LIGADKKPLTKKESAKVIEAAIRQEIKKPTGELTKADLTKLVSLKVHRSTITNLDALEGLVNIKVLDLFGNSDLRDITALRGLKNLERLTLYYPYPGSKALKDITAIQGLTKLKSLNLQRCTNVSDVSALKGLTNLKSLNLSHTNISDVSALKDLKNIEVLDIGYTKVNDVSALKDLKNLKRLTMWSTKVKDISAFKNLNKLEYLNISNDVLDKGHVLDALKDINVRVMVPVRTDGRKAMFMYWKERKKEKK
jgi:internalin A